MREPYYLQRELDRQRERVRELEADVNLMRSQIDAAQANYRNMERLGVEIERLRALIDAVLKVPTWEMTRGSIESARAPLGDTRCYYGEYVLADDVLGALQVPR
jgi:multidrug resistance efflux pump